MARMRNSSILMIAVVSAFLAFFISIRFLNTTREATVATVSSVQVIGVVRDVAMGTSLRKEDLDLFPSPVNLNPKVLFTDFNSVIGKITRRNISKGEVIKTIDLFAEGDSVSSLIPQGYRAVSIPVTLPAGMKGLIQPGNRIDVLMTYQKGQDVISLTLAENIKVLAVSSGANESQRSISVAVTPMGAETLAYSSKKGTLSVAVRSFSDDGSQAEKIYSLKELFFKKQEIDVVEPTEIEIIRGLKQEKFTTVEEQRPLMEVSHES